MFIKCTFKAKLSCYAWVLDRASLINHKNQFITISVSAFYFNSYMINEQIFLFKSIMKTF